MNPVIDGYRLDEPIDTGRPQPSASDSRRAPGDLGQVRRPFDPPGVAGAPERDGTRCRVWRGARVSDGLPVAVKVFPLAQAGLARREAALLAAVEHPHVVALIEIAHGPGHVGLVTELAAGGSLRSLLARRRRLPWQEALTVLIPLADALAVADERGMVHGDLSTGNVLFDAAGRPLLADLGAARAAAELSAPVAVTVTDVAPEVARGAVPDHRSDLFSLGSVALQCLSGRPAWPADTVMDVLIESTAGRWPDPDDVIAPEDLLRVVRRLLDPDPGRRGSAAAAAVDLRGVGGLWPVDLVAKGVDGRPRLPATEVRPDVAALRRAELSSSARRRRGGWRRRRDRQQRTDDHGRPDRRARRPASGGRHAATRAVNHRRGSGRVRGVVFALVVALVLGAGAVRVGLWWAGSGRAAPAAVQPVTTAVDMTATDVTAGPAVRPAADRPAAGGPDAVAPGIPPDPSSSSALSTPPASGPGETVDWTAVVAALDLARARALVRLDPALLDLVYAPGVAARSQDAATIRRLTASGYHLTAAAHQIDEVVVLPPSGWPPGWSGGSGWSVPGIAAGATAVRVVESMPAVRVTDGAGRVLGETAAAPATAVVLLVLRTGDSFRIGAVEPG